MQAHLDQCPSCRREVEWLREFHEACVVASAEPGAATGVQRLRQHLEAPKTRSGAMEWLRSRWSRAQPWSRRLIMAELAVIAALGALAARRRGSRRRVSDARRGRRRRNAHREPGRRLRSCCHGVGAAANTGHRRRANRRRPDAGERLRDRRAGGASRPGLARAQSAATRHPGRVAGPGRRAMIMRSVSRCCCA